MSPARRLAHVRTQAWAALLLAALLGGSLAAPAPVAAAGDRIDSAVQTYTVDPVSRRLDVVIDVTVTNLKADTATVAYYLDATSIAVEQGAVNLKVTADAGPASLALSQRGTGFNVYRIRFSNLFSGRTRNLKVTYQLPSGAPRSDSDTRIGPAVASFCVVSNGFDSGRTRVAIPSSYTIAVRSHGGTLTTGAAGGMSTYDTGTLRNPSDFWACFDGYNLAGYQATALTTNGRQVQVQSWPEDPTWRQTVSTQAASSIAALERLIGRPLPGTGPITIREMASGSLGAYAGFFDPVTGLARIGEEIQAGVVPHELAHAWFNDSLFDARWLSEGHAGWAESSVTGTACAQPAAYPGSGAPALSVWKFAGPRATAQDLAVVAWEYDAACHLVSAVAVRAGTDRMRQVLAALLDGRSPYQTGSPVLKPSGPADWRDWLDAVDELGLAPAGVADLDFASQLVTSYGAAGAADRAQLAARSAAREQYHALLAELAWTGASAATTAGPGTTTRIWQVPEAILGPMTAWEFSLAGTALASASKAWASVARADAVLPEAAVRLGAVKPHFEGARHGATMTDVEAKASDQLAGAEAVAAARSRVQAPRPIVSALGFAPAKLEAELVTAVAAVTVADLAAATATVAAIDRALADELAAAKLVTETREQLAAPRDPLTAAGLVGTDLDTRLSLALAAVQGVDLASAQSYTASIQGDLAGAQLQGAIRLAVLLLLLAACALLRVQSRRSGRLAAARVAAAPTEAPPPAAPPPAAPPA